MKCKKCGKEIVGEIQRYCNACKSQVRGESIGPAEHYEEKVASQASLVQEEILEKEPKAEKKHRVFSLGYILLIIFMMILTFLASCVGGFVLGPVLPI